MLLGVVEGQIVSQIAGHMPRELAYSLFFAKNTICPYRTVRYIPQFEKRHVTDVLAEISRNNLEQLQIQIFQADLSLPIVVYENIWMGRKVW